MNELISHLADAAPAERLLLKITLLLAAAWLVHAALRDTNPRWRVLLWRVVVMGLLVLPVAQLSLPRLNVTLHAEPPATPEPGAAALPRIDGGASVAALPELTGYTALASTPETGMAPFRRWVERHRWLAPPTLWALASLLFLVKLSMGIFRVRAALRRATPAPPEITRLAGHVAQRMECTAEVALRALDGLGSPFLTGFRRPVIVLPKRMLDEESEDALGGVLAHEFAHVKGNDWLWIVLGEITCALYWFHPLVWPLRSAHRGACEDVCDAVAAEYQGSAEFYAGALARTALATLHAQAAPGGVPMVGRASILRRIEKIKAGIRALPLRRRWVTVAVCLAAAGIGVLGSLRLATAAPESRSTSEEARKAESGAPGKPRAWEMLRQANVGIHLSMMAMRLQPFAEDPAKMAPAPAAPLDGKIELEVLLDDAHVNYAVVGAFTDAKWSADPVVVERIEAPKGLANASKVELRVPAGDYVIGAMNGRLPFVVVGVSESWPAPIHVASGATAKARLMFAEEFENALQPAGSRVLSTAWDAPRNPGSAAAVLDGTVTGPDGRPVPGALIQIREADAGKTEIFAADVVTDFSGHYHYEGKKLLYNVYALWTESLPEVFGERHRFQKIAGPVESATKLDLQFPSFPSGSCTIRGRFIGSDGAPVRQFYLDVNERDNQRFGYRIPVSNAEGAFHVGGLAAGDYRVSPIAMDSREFSFNQFHDVAVVNGATADMGDIRIEINPTYYCRLLFDDGTPVYPPKDSDAKKRVSISIMADGRGTGIGTTDEQGNAKLRISPQEAEACKKGASTLSVGWPKGKESFTNVGNIPFDKVTTDPNAVQTITLPRPVKDDTVRERFVPGSPPSSGLESSQGAAFTALTPAQFGAPGRLESWNWAGIGDKFPVRKKDESTLFEIRLKDGDDDRVTLEILSKEATKTVEIKRNTAEQVEVAGANYQIRYPENYIAASAGKSTTNKAMLIVSTPAREAGGKTNSPAP